MGKFKEFMKGNLPEQRFNANFGDGHVYGYQLRYVEQVGKSSKFKKLDTKGLTAKFMTGAQVNSYVSKGAVGVGAGAGLILFGPIGALAGGLIGSAKRKGGTQIYVVVEREGHVIGTFSGDAKKEKEAMAFISALNGSAAEQEQNDA